MYNTEQKAYFSAELLSWYRRHKRDLPWRRSRNPYHIWISEIMLQQTRVETVIPYFHRFVDKFPTVEALADAPEDEVLKAWEGLGYYSRARNLQSAVREVKERYGSVVPDTKEEVFALKGVGPYTAGAILSIAYNKPEPAVDGNVMRVLSRYFLIEEDIMKGSTRVLMEKLAKELIPEGAAGDFNQALMELGAMVCTPKSPHCLTCPVMLHCSGRAAGMEAELPVKKKAKPPRPENRYVALLEGTGGQAGRVLIRQRPAEGLLARMWELPHSLAPAAAAVPAEGQAAYAGGPGEDPAAAHEALAGHLAEDGIGLGRLRWLMPAEHTFSHIHWDLDVFLGSVEASPLRPESSAPLPSHYRWLSEGEMEQYAFPNVFLRILRAYFKDREA
ncbi:MULTISPECIES: A/G-specific adenine glycosylase [Paenibacillus]|uniref:A/G-specific adenine glycosylase n=1 Tax=Paenibacillus TaxID=44249 RepID=UPI0022B93130|nr:A/G-specific adenine glycosylase [Paenibacillus caseinilyticus]MCZ8523877.1 A/G-specific adenine glycosylase [Paenibacillus caseinilyticus]